MAKYDPYDWSPMVGKNEKGFGKMVSKPETDKAMQARIGQQYGAMSQMAKMREQSQRQGEQSAIQRRLAASGMGASGAGMRMQSQADQAAGRRAAETQLGIASEQAGAQRSAFESMMGRNLQREGMRIGAAESAAGRNLQRDQLRLNAKQDASRLNMSQNQFNQQFGFDQEKFKWQQDQTDKEFARDTDIMLGNQALARETQRYNSKGLLGQLGEDFFGSSARKTSMRTPLGAFG